jgi:flagellar hook-associated protein 2
MANIQFGGLITGLDTNALISSLVKAEQRPSVLLQGQKTTLQAQQGIYTAVIASLAGLKSAAQNLSLADDFNRKSVSSSDPTVVTATADAAASAGSNSIVVDTVAKAQSIESIAFGSAADAIGTGTLTIHVGADSTNITLDGTNNTLSGLKTAINNSGAAVSASIVNIGTGLTPDYRLVVRSKNTGTENAVTITGSLSAGADPFVGGGQIVQAAADALFAVNGLTVTRGSNTISDVLSGVTFTLLKEGDHDGVVESTDSAANLAVAVDGGAIQDAIHKLADNYNAVNKIINDQFTLNPDTKRQGALAGDAGLRGVIRRLRNELSAAGGIGAGIAFISDIGIKFAKDGSLTVDDAKLSHALESDAAGVSNLFNLTQNGIGKRVPDAVDDFISSLDGTLTSRQKGLQQSIDRIDHKVASENSRIAALEARLTKQFSDLESVVSQLKKQGDFLTQQVSALSRR